MKIETIFENENLIVINKPAGVIVHEGAGSHEKTLVDWLIDQYPSVNNLNWDDKSRPGIVHRLDKDTSGLMILAKNPETLNSLQKNFSEHKILKKYYALVFGKIESGGEIKSFIGRNQTDRLKQSSTLMNFSFTPKARPSKTCYDVLKHYKFQNDDLTLVEAKIETGRMHQIRVQFKSLGHPIVGDQTYNTKPSRKLSEKLNIFRQFLHSEFIQFKNPEDSKSLSFKSDLPEDLKEVLRKLN